MSQFDKIIIIIIIILIKIKIFVLCSITNHISIKNSKYRGIKNSKEPKKKKGKKKHTHTHT